MSYLGYGATTSSEEFGETVERAIRFLVDAQESSGLFAGRDGNDYTQPMAAYALSEAYGMTKIPMVRDAALKAIEVVVEGQNPTGSFNYNLRPSDRDDMSYASWCVQALKASETAGLHRDLPGITNAMERAVDGIKGHFVERGDAGVFGYGRGSARFPGLTGSGVLSLQFLGEGDSRKAQLGLAHLEEYPFDWENTDARSPVYYWYYNTQAYFQEGGSTWEAWNEEFSVPLVEVQNVISKEESGYVDHEGEPQEIGFWENENARDYRGDDELFVTILCTLMLEVYYRYLPTFQQIDDQEIEEELGDEDDLVIEIVQTHQESREPMDPTMVAQAR